MMKNIFKHIVSIVIMSLFIFLSYFVISLPAIGVFIMDDNVLFSDIFSIYFMLLRLSFLITVFYVFPLNIFFDFLSKKNKVSEWRIPLLVVFIVNIVFFVFFIVTYSHSAGIFDNFIISVVVMYGSILFLLYRVLYKGIDFIFFLLKKILRKVEK